MNDNKKEIIELLRSIKRPGMENVITWLDTAPSFFVASGARIHHDNVEGGLAYHSLKVYKLAKAEWEKRDAAFKQEYPLESVTISALLHDVCKKDVYYIDADGNPTWNEENHRKGHGLRSVHLLEELGLELTPEQTRRVTQRITELGDKKEIVTQEDLPFIVSDVLKHDAPEDKVKLVSYVVSTAYGLKPGANIKVEINGQQYEASATGDGQYDAFVKSLRYIYKKYLDRTFPILQNYAVTIPPGGRTDALVQTVITWNDNGRILRTRGLDADQTEAAIKATFKMLNIYENEQNNEL